MIKLGGIAAGLLLVGMAGYGAGLAARGSVDPPAVKGRPPADPDGPAGTIQAKSGPDAATPKEKPKVASVKPVTVRSHVEGVTTILKIVPDGTLVKKGDVVCELDSSSLRDQLVNQWIAVKAAEAAHTNAKLSHEVAEVSFRAHREGDFLTQLNEAEGDIKIAQAEMELAQLELTAAKTDPTSGTLAIKRAEVGLLRARVALEKAQSRKKLLADFNGPRKIQELESAVKKAQADERVRLATWELEAQRERNLERQIANCTLTAPIDGRVRYLAGPSSLVIGEGIAVQYRQDLLAIEPQDQPAPAGDKDKPSAAGH